MLNEWLRQKDYRVTGSFVSGPHGCIQVALMVPLGTSCDPEASIVYSLVKFGMNRLWWWNLGTKMFGDVQELRERERGS